MPQRSFVDTNVLVYAHDRGAGTKHALARDLVARLWDERIGVISTQVIQELFVNLRRKASRPVSHADTRLLINDYLTWKVVVNDGDAILQALDLEERYQLSFWDALIIAAAISAGGSTLYSEDLSHGQLFGEVRVANPFV